MSNVCYIKIGKHNWVKNYSGRYVSMFSTKTLPDQLMVTDDLDEAAVFHYLDPARRVAEAFGGTIYAPKGRLAPISDEEVNDNEKSY